MPHISAVTPFWVLASRVYGSPLNGFRLAAFHFLLTAQITRDVSPRKRVRWRSAPWTRGLTIESLIIDFFS
jgi:hypothetical protein